MKKYLLGLAIAAMALAIGGSTATGFAEDVQPTVINGRLMLVGGSPVYMATPVTIVCTNGADTFTTETATRDDGTISVRLPGCLPGWQVTATARFVYAPNGLTYESTGQGTVSDYFVVTNMYASLYVEPPTPEPTPTPTQPTTPPVTPTTPTVPETPATPQPQPHQNPKPKAHHKHHHVIKLKPVRHQIHRTLSCVQWFVSCHFHHR